jgi:hypothetical protein
MAIEYFGNNKDDIYNYAVKSLYYLVAGYICPGSGPQDLKTLDLNIYGVDTGNLRVGLWDSDHNMVCQWDTVKTPVGTGWLEVTSFVNYAGNPVTPQLTGGATYYLGMAGDASNAHLVYYSSVASGTAKYLSGVYSDALPAVLTGGTNGTREYCVRAGVEAAAGGSIVPIILQHIHRMMPLRYVSMI